MDAMAQVNQNDMISLAEVWSFWSQPVVSAIVDPTAPGSGIIAGIEGAGMGFLAAVDGALNMIPGVQLSPFESYGWYDSSQFGLGASQAIGGVTRDAALFFYGAHLWRAIPVLGGGRLPLRVSFALSAAGWAPLGVVASGGSTTSLVTSFVVVNSGRVSTAFGLYRRIDPDE